MKLTVDMTLTPRQLAEVWCEMNDEDQAQFFIEAAAIIRTWPDIMGRQLQAMEVGKHLAECSCSNDDARELVRDIVAGMEPYRETGQ